MENKHIETLLVKFFTGEASREEEKIIQDWIAKSEDNQKEFEVYNKLWLDSEKLMMPGVIDVESALQKTKNQIPQFRKKIHLLNYWRQAAAILITAVVLSSVFNYIIKPQSTKTAQVIYQELKSVYGAQTKVQLADGTTVWLNSGSKLNFPTSFENLPERNVTLVGEGYFDVAKNPKQPFIVHTSQLDVKVLGTSFNVNAYESEKIVTVALVEGKVSLIKHIKGKEKPLLNLKPNEVAKYDVDNNKLIHTKEVDLEKYTSWKDGKIVFNNEPLEKVVAKLENWYNVTIEVKDKQLLKYCITGTFDNESLDQVLYYLSLSSPIDYKIVAVDDKEDKGKKQKVILSQKKDKK